MTKANHNILPLIILFLVIGILAVLGYAVYTIAQGIGKTTREKMESKHIAITRDGMKVQVKEVKDEEYKDNTQR